MYKITIRNFCLWFWDQLHHEHPFRNLFITRNAWSAFSVYSHIRRSDGMPKIAYPSKKVAKKAAEKMGQKHCVHFSVYKCLYCNGWHVGRNKDNKSAAQTLYAQLVAPSETSKFNMSDAGEGMCIAEEVIWQYWKPRFLLDHNAKCAYEFMTREECLSSVSEDDIDWETLNDLSPEVLDRAHRLYAHFPTFIYRFENGEAEVCWQLNPDGMYYRDEDGYGLTDDQKVELYGSIDRKGKVVKKFTLKNGFE